MGNHQSETTSLKCVVCNGTEVVEQEVREELRQGSDVVLAPVKCLVCQTCGERYYDRPTVQYLETLRQELKTGEIELKQIGKVYELTQPGLRRAA